jgi:serine protease Do
MKKLITILAMALPGALFAVPKVESLGDLRQVETRVKAVVETRTDCTISLVSPELGASGSGVIVSADGLILTAAHVVEGSREMTVIFPNGSQAKAKVLGANYNRDAAMAQLVGEGPWPFAEVGDSAALEVGDFVVAMGHPKGYDPTRRPPVRFGRIMNKGDLGFITTDCTLIGGDSGGPVFDLDGRVIGIHSHIASDRQVNRHAGVTGFKSSWQKMLDGKTWGKLGTNGADPNRPVLGLVLEPAEGGMRVKEARDGSPAFTAGIRTGDLVVEIAGLEISDPNRLNNIFADYQAGEKVPVIIYRDGKEETKTVTLGRLGEIYKTYRR